MNFCRKQNPVWTCNLLTQQRKNIGNEALVNTCIKLENNNRPISDTTHAVLQQRLPGDRFPGDETVPTNNIDLLCFKVTVLHNTYISDLCIQICKQPDQMYWSSSQNQQQVVWDVNSFTSSAVIIVLMSIFAANSCFSMCDAMES